MVAILYLVRADAFAREVAPVIRDAQKAGATTLQAISDVGRAVAENKAGRRQCIVDDPSKRPLMPTIVFASPKGGAAVGEAA